MDDYQSYQYHCDELKRMLCDADHADGLEQFEHTARFASIAKSHLDWLAALPVLAKVEAAESV